VVWASFGVRGFQSGGCQRPSKLFLFRKRVLGVHTHSTPWCYPTVVRRSTNTRSYFGSLNGVVFLFCSYFGLLNAAPGPRAGRGGFGPIGAVIDTTGGPRGPEALPGHRKHYRCLRSECLSKPYELEGFGAMDVTKPYRYIGFGDIPGPKPYKFTGFR
jgi:hypothetical protein